MKCSVERDALHGIVREAVRVVQKRNIIPILGNILLTAKSGRLHVRSTDLDMQFDASVPADVETPGEITVGAYRIESILKNSPSGSSVSLSIDKGQVKVRCGRASFKIVALPASDFPKIEAGDLSHTFEISREDLTRLIEKTEFAISEESARYFLNGIFLQAIDVAGELMLRAVTTDGHKLALAEIPAPAGSAGIPGVIIPRLAVGAIKALAKSSGEPIKISLSRAKIRFDFGEAVLTSKLIDGTFPDYQAVIPRNNEKRIVLDRDASLKAIERVAIVLEKGRGIKLTLDDGKLTLSASADSGVATEDIEVDYSSDPIEVGFNSSYLRAILGAIDSDTAIVDLNDPGSPALIRSREGSSERFVLMPMRV